MRKIFTMLAALAWPLSMPAQVIDQQSSGGTLFSQIPQWTGQSFTTGATELVGGGFLLFASSGQASVTGTFTVSLYAGPLTAGWSPLASSSVNFTIQTGSFLWADAFWSPVGVSAGNGQYYLYGQGTVDTPESAVYIMAGSGYAGGSVSVESGVNFSNLDAAFRTWKPTPAPMVPGVELPSTAVPEPSTWVLLVVGAVPLAFRAGYRRRVLRS